MQGYIAAAAAVLTLLAIAVPAAGAQEPGVFVDPDSPTGAEYDIPLERARRQASSSPEAGSAPSRTPAETLFGEGIEPAQAGGAEPRARSDGSGGETAEGDTGIGRKPARERSRARRTVPPTVEAALTNPGAPGGGTGSTLLVGGVAVLVLTAGVAGGLALRRRRGEG